MRAATHLSWLRLSHLCSHPPAKTSPTFSTASVITDSAVPMMEGAIVLKTASQGTAKMTTLPSHCTNATTYAVHPPAEQHPSRRPAYIAQARLEGEQSSAQKKTRDSSIKAALSLPHKHKRYSPPPAKPAPSVSATSAVIDILVPMMGRTTIRVYTATPSIARIRLSDHRDVSAVGQALQHIRPKRQPLSNRYV